MNPGASPETIGAELDSIRGLFEAPQEGEAP